MIKPSPLLKRLPPLPKEPLVSVVVTNYNYSRFIKGAVESVLNQTYQNFEIVVCDDGSTDESPKILKKLSSSDGRIKTIFKENGGHASALNAALEQAKGDIVTFLDADDEWYSNRLKAVVDTFFAEPEVGVVVHHLRVEEETGKCILPFYPRELDKGWLLPKALRGEQINLPPSSAIALHKTVCELIFPLPSSFRSWADRLLVERASFISRVAAINTVLGIYRQHRSNLTGYAGPSSPEIAQHHLLLLRNLLLDHEAFISRFYSKEKLDTSYLGREVVGTALCVERLLMGKKFSYKELRARLNPKRALAWRLLFSLPSPLAKGLYLFWRKKGLSIKRFTEIS